MNPFGPFGNMMPYSNFHGMNLDWVIQIAKDFLDQYTHIQETIDEGLEELDDKATSLQALLQEWYDTHSVDIADQLAQALSDLNDWYTTHEEYLDNILAANVQSFQEQAIDIANETIESIPTDYTDLYNMVMFMKNALGTNSNNLLKLLTTPTYTNHGVTYINNGDGGFTVQGTATANGSTSISPEITLPAGTYRVGFFTNSTVNLQIRKYENGADVGGLAQTTTRTDITLSETTTIVAAFYNANGVSYNTTIYPAVMLAEDWDVFEANYVANDTVARQAIQELQDHYFSMSAIPNGTDINEMNTPGLYRGVSSYNYTNLPDTLNRINFILQVIIQEGTQYRVQTITTYGSQIPYQIFTRIKSGSPATWGTWKNQFDGTYCTYGILIPTETDFDTITEKQIYRALSTYTYYNTPDGFSGNYTLEVVPFTSNYILQRAVNYGAKSLKIATRVKSGSPNVWSSWNIQLDVGEVTSALANSPAYSVESFTRKAFASQGENTGKHIKFLCYNVANYNKDTSRYISDEKLINLKKFLMNYNADFITLQEESQYIDGISQSSTDYIYKPVWPFVAGVGGPTIRSKIDYESTETLSYTNGRVLRYALYTLDNITLLVVNTHPSPASDPEGESKREAQYRELFSWLTGQIALETYSGGTFVTCPEYTHCIIGMDGNSKTNTDKTNLETYANTNGFLLANGGPLGWCITHPAIGEHPDMALDNIIVSNNIIIDNFATYLNQYSQLYSDHIPISAELTLL